ncbi:MAG: hypothetical protein ABI977_11365 [Acidobacteriota bacterium]
MGSNGFEFLENGLELSGFDISGNGEMLRVPEAPDNDDNEDEEGCCNSPVRRARH